MSRKGTTTVLFTRERIEDEAFKARRAQTRRQVFANDPDYNLRGYRLAISKHGGVRFTLVYPHPQTKRKRILTLGKWPGMTDAEARRKVLAARAQINRGIDPIEFRDGRAAPANGLEEGAIG